MTRRQVTLALAAIFALALGLRVLALFIEPPHHPDELFQYLEPAWRHLTGAGVETWEWRRGVRSWVLPGYHGAWMALLMRLGVRDGVVLATLMRAHWALLSLTLVWAGWRGGMLLGRTAGADKPSPTMPTSSAAAPPRGYPSGLLAALLCAAFPLLVRFSVHTLSELASILCMVFAVVLAGELAAGPARGQARKAAWLGVLVGLGVCLRIQHAIVPLVIAVQLLMARRARQLGLVTAASLAPVALFGAVDWLTWGSPFHSFVSYIQFNLFEGGAAIFGKLPWAWYAAYSWHRLPLALPIVGLLCLLGLRRSWPYVVSALGLVGLLSTQTHKEERFVMLFWPLVLIPAAAYVGTWLATCRAGVASEPTSPRWWPWLGRSLASLFVVLVLGDGLLHCKGNDFAGLTPARFQAQRWAGQQPDITGLIYDEPLFVGGYLWWSKPLPQVMYKHGLLENPLFSHLLTDQHADRAQTARNMGFTKVYTAGDIVVLKRP